MMAVAPAAPPPLWTFSGGRMELNLHRGQAEAWLSNRRFVMMIAGTQSGKTSFGPLWLWREIERGGPGDYMVVTPTVPLLQLKVLPEFLTLFKDTLKLGTWMAGDKVFALNNGGRVIFRSATNPSSLESATAKAAWLDECGMPDFRLESWQAILRRLALYEGRVLGTTTPYAANWLKFEVYDRWRQGDADYRVVQFDSMTNPIFRASEFERARETMPDWKFRMFYRGEITRPDSLIYGDFLDRLRTEGGHLIPPRDLPPAWPRWGSWDFGGANNARLLAAEDPDAHVLYVYDSILEGNKTTKEHVEAALLATRGVNMERWVGGAPSETQQRRDYADAGLDVQQPPISDVEAGIDRVIELLKSRRIFFFENLKGLRDEMALYQRPTDASGQPMEGIVDKATFHRLDTVRYLAAAYAGPDTRAAFY